jgi:hypothetical protein
MVCQPTRMIVMVIISMVNLAGNVGLLNCGHVLNYGKSCG